MTITWQEVAKFLLVFGLAWGVLLLLIWADERADRRANRRIDERFTEPLSNLDRYDGVRSQDELMP